MVCSTKKSKHDLLSTVDSMLLKKAMFLLSSVDSSMLLKKAMFLLSSVDSKIEEMKYGWYLSI